MNLLIIVVSVILPLLPLILFPARTMGRGGMWTLVGAAMLIGLMMILFFGVQGMSDDATSIGADVPQLSDSDMQALAKVLQ